MSSLILDTGALIALDRGDHDTWALLREALEAEGLVHVPTGAIGQAWRDGRRQVLLIKALANCEEVTLDGAAARAAGVLCRRSGSADVIDASVAVAAEGLARYSEVVVLTSDPEDIALLASTLNGQVKVVGV